MPIELSTPSTFITTVPLFLNHWADVNATMPGGVVLDREQTQRVEDVSWEDFDGLFTELQEARAAIEEALLEASIARAEGGGHRTWLQSVLTAFNRAMRADHGTSPLAANLALAPAVDAAREKFVSPMRLTASLWAKINAVRAAQTPPRGALTLPAPGPVAGPAVTLADFNARLDLLRTALDLEEERGQQAGIHRAERNALQGVIYGILKVYRLKVAAILPPGAPLLATLPALTEDATATPQPGTLAGDWSPTQGKATLTGTPSPSPSVVRHQIRAAVGPVPAAEDEGVRAEFALGTPIALATDYGLGAPGATVHFRLVALTADGHEKGTPWVTVERPA